VSLYRNMSFYNSMARTSFQGNTCRILEWSMSSVLATGVCNPLWTMPHARVASQGFGAATYCSCRTISRRPGSPVRDSRNRSHHRSGPRSITQYDRVTPHWASEVATRRPPAQFPVILEPENNGDVILASFPATVQPLRMHRGWYPSRILTCL
jgi:hypothetical protein